MYTLDYINRSENAKASENFQWFADNECWDLVTGKLKRLAGIEDPAVSSTKGQLFAHPWRDYLYQKAKDEGGPFTKPISQMKADARSGIHRIYKQDFFDLQDKIWDFPGFSDSINKRYLKRSKSYNAEENSVQLWTNVYSTELDILMADDYNVYVGEAKGETRPNASASERMLVHQLVRGYVVVKIWVEYRKLKKPDGNPMSVIPFIVADVAKAKSKESLMNNNQVKFMMIDQELLKAEHVLDLGDTKKLRTASA